MVVITGRENVGKSTLFNRIVGKNVAVVGRTPGITRDFMEKWVIRDRFMFRLIDTGGVFPCKMGIKKKVQEKIKEVISRASLVLFMVDVKDGITPLDEGIALFLRNTGKPVWLLVNKAETKQRTFSAQNFLVLGFKHLYPISALRGYGVEGLVEDIMKEVEIIPSTSFYPPVISIMGRPNVGKSTYINTLLGSERMIVDETPQTTIDVCDIQLHFHGRAIVLTDTPGLKRKTKSDLERGVTALTISNTKRIDVGIVMIESNSNLTREDKRIVNLLLRRGKGVVIAANKSDLGKYFLGHTIPFIPLPIVYLSALNHSNIEKPLEVALKVYEERRKKILPDDLDILRSQMKHIRLSGLYQISTSPPKFRINRKNIRQNELKYIERCIREQFGFCGVPIEFKLLGG